VIVPGALHAQTARERQVPHSREVPVNAKEWQLKPLRRENDNSVPFKAKMSCKHGYIGYANMLYLFRKIS